MQGGKQPGPHHPITVEPAAQRVIVRAGGAVLADSRNALLLREGSLPPVFYIPRDEVAMQELMTSRTRTHCPFKGDASYFSRKDHMEDIAWSYEDPFDHVLAIKGHLAFYAGRVDDIETYPRD